jgi:hypothetical protein
MLHDTSGSPHFTICKASWRWLSSFANFEALYLKENSTATSLPILDHKSLHLILQASDLSHQVTSLIRRNTGRDDGAAHTTGATQCGLRRHVHVWHILVLAQKREVEKDSERSRVGSEDDYLGDAAIEGFGSYEMPSLACGAYYG